MSTIDLIILGSLCQSPKSAYDLQKQIESRNLSRWIKIGSFTVYKKVVQYESKGYVISETVKNGNMPEKTVYTITPKGKEIFKELMTKFSLTETRVFLDFNAVIVNLESMSKEMQKECLDNIEEHVKMLKDYLNENISLKEKDDNVPLTGKEVLKQQFILVQAIEEWIASLKSICGRAW